ncbi:MAG TPA: hypothetical protein VHW45_10980 [Candidatus Sulfotelmatobacter sp.]|jgi:outer membrane lipoprotein-sorting protein|nr:hypothetical protein [Candidatus Sulfotelmatobacter sp.]
MASINTWRWRTKLKFVVGCVLLALFLLPAIGSAQENVETIISRSVQANNHDWDSDPKYDFSERDRDGADIKTYDVKMIFGSPYERLVAINGKPLDGTRQEAEQRKFEHTLHERKSESPEKRTERIGKYNAERKRDHAMLTELTKAFNFKLTGEETLNDHKVYVLEATPRPGYRPPSRNARVLTGMRGRLWIDQKTFQWVKVEANVIHPVAIEGFIARVQPGTHFELEKAPVSSDIWLPTHFAMKASAKVMLVWNHNSQEDDYYFNYHPTPPTPSN